MAEFERHLAAVSDGDGGMVVPPPMCSSGKQHWGAFQDVLHKAGFPPDAPALVRKPRHTAPQQHAKHFSKSYETHKAHIDNEWLEQQKENCQHNWNAQVGSVALFIDSIKVEINGYDSRMLESLAACIQLVLAHCQTLVHGPCLDEFKAEVSPDMFDGHLHRQAFAEFKKDCKTMKDMNWGAFCAWQPPFDLGQAFCLHIKVPRFADPKNGDKEAARHVIYEACLGNGKANVWWAKSGIHCSDKDGQRHEDFLRHTCGTNVMVKFMICAHEEMVELFEIAKGQ